MYIKFTDQTTYLDVVQLDNSFVEIPGTRSAVLSPNSMVRHALDASMLVITGVAIPYSSVKFGSLVDATNTPFASRQAAYAYVSALFAKFLTGYIPGGGGGGGGDASASKQTDQINQQKSTQVASAWGASTDELTTAQWLAKLNVKDSGLCWAKDIAFDVLVLMSIARNEAGVPVLSYYLQDGTPYLPSNPTDVVPLEALILSGQTDAQQVVQIVDAEGDGLMVTPEGYLTVIPQGIPYSFVKRLQVSDTQMQFDAKHLKDKLPLLFDEILNGAATSTWNTNRVDMTVTNAGDYAIRQSFRQFNYTSDRPIVFAFTQQSLQPQAGSVKRVGAFTGGTVAPYNTFDGVFVESDDTTTALKVYRGGAVAGSVDITFWINGASAMNLTGGTIFECEYLWLGYGGVSLSTYINGSKVIAAVIYFDQAVLNPFLNSPNKPIRYELRSTGGAASLSQVCAAVQTEGSSSFLGLDYGIDSGSTLPTLASTGTRYIMAALRLKSTHLDMASLIEEFGAMFTSNDDALVEVIVNPTTTTGVITFSDVDTNVNLQKFIASGAITQTITAFPAQNKIFSQYARKGTTITGRLDGKRRLGSSINGTPDTVYFCITPLSADLTAGISIKLSDIN